MPSFGRAEFGRRLWGLSREAFVRFVAKLWAARGWETQIEGDTVIATRSGTDRTLLVRHRDGWIGRSGAQARPDPDAAIDIVVTSGRGEGRAARLARALDADLHAAADLYEQLVYGLDADARERLVDAYLDDASPATAWLAPHERARILDDAREAVRTPRGAITAALAVGLLSLLVAGAFATPAYLGAGAADDVETPRPIVPSPTATPTDAPTSTATPWMATAGVETTMAPREPEQTRTPPGAGVDEPIGAGGDAWRTFRGNLARTGHAPAGSRIDIGGGERSGPTLIAAVTGGGDPAFHTVEDVVASPAVVNDTVYVGSADGNLYAFDAATLGIEWAAALGGSVTASATVANGTVYVGSVREQSPDTPAWARSERRMYALDAATGDERWLAPTGSVSLSSPAVANGTVYVGGLSGEVYALDAANGTVRWRFETNGSVLSSPAVVGGAVYVGSTDGNLYAIDAATGAPRWAFPTEGDVVSSPAVVNGTVYVGSADGNLYAVDAATGRAAWNRSLGDGVFSSPAVANGTVYVGSTDARLYALDGTNGTIRWRFETNGSVLSSPAVVGGVVYVGSTDGNLYAVDATTGAGRWRFDAGEAIVSSPAVANGVVYVGSLSGNVYAVLAPADGADGGAGAPGGDRARRTAPESDRR